MKFAFRELTLTAGQRKRIDDVASFFMLVSNTGDKKIKISIDDDPLSECPVGYEYQEKEKDSFYSHIDFMNPSASSATIEYIMSIGLVRSSPTMTSLDNILAELQGDTTPETWGNIILVDPVTATLLLAANTDRKGLLLQMETAASCGVFLGFDNTVSIANYFRALQYDDAGFILDCVFRMNDYRGPIWGLSTGAGIYVAASEW